MKEAAKSMYNVILVNENIGKRSSSNLMISNKQNKNYRENDC